MQIEIKYHDPNMPKISKTVIGDWIDLRSKECVSLKSGQFALIDLGVSIRPPEGYEVILAPRSSTFKNYGIIQSNGIGIIDESYSSNKDVYKMPVYATRDTLIDKYDRICQFRIQKKMPKVDLIEVDNLGNNERGGFGSTGKN